MKFRYDKSRALLVASTLAVIGLVIFQLTWMRHSRKLSEEIFNQRVYMALCSTVEDYGGGALCTKTGSGATCLQPDMASSSFVIPTDLVADSAFNAQLRSSLDFYQVDIDYTMSMSEAPVTVGCESQVFQCAIAIPTDTIGESAFIHLTFEDKDKFMLGKMSYMVVSTILILLFIAIVLLFANWSFLKQKRLLETNIDFFNNMAHEFRTPLTNMGLALKMLTKKHTDLKTNDFVKILRQENTKLLSQVERVLDMAAVENGDALQKERLHLKTLLQSIRDEMAIQIRDRNANVSMEDVPESFEVYGDKMHLGNVFRNLLDNALKYSSANPEIRISAQEHAKGISISVADNGIGIPSAQSELIFEKFQRAGNGAPCAQNGFGLGLAYVKRMVELHHGSVSVNSEVNKGSRFEIVLPAL